MNAPLPLHVTPVVTAPALPVRTPRDIPAAFMAALQARFAANCSTARVVCEQHGRDESSFDAPPPAAAVFAQDTQDVADAVMLASAMELTASCATGPWVMTLPKNTC